MRNLSRLLALVLVVGAAAIAEARPTHFLGPHPIPGKHHGYCYIEAPHMHDYSPDRQNLYQQVDGQWVFTGDPTPFGYDGERHRWQGHHPVVVDGVVQPGVYCVIDGPHVHEYAPPPDPAFTVQNDVAVYVAPIPPVYVPAHRVRVVNAEYRPLLIASAPGIEVAAPGVSVEVSAPGIVVAPPMPPSIVVTPPSPPSIVVEAPHPVFVAPGPPGVVVAGPRPVVVGAPGPVYVEHRDHWRHEEHEEHWEHHDNGKHKGWYK